MLNWDPDLPFGTSSMKFDVSDTSPTGEDLTLRLHKNELDNPEDLVLGYRHTEQTEDPFERGEMEWCDQGYQATIPDEYFYPELGLLIYVFTTDSNGNAVLYPRLDQVEESAPCYIVRIEMVVAGKLQNLLIGSKAYTSHDDTRRNR